MHSPKPMRIVIAGDVTIDYNLAIQNNVQKFSTWDPQAETTVCRRRGGAALLADLISDLQLPAETIKYMPIPNNDPCPEDAKFPQSWAIWSLFPTHAEGVTPAWRVKEFLGLDRPRRNSARPSITTDSSCGECADFIVLDDANLGFRNDPKAWPSALNKTDSQNKPAGILLKMASPLAEGQLWRHLLNHFADRLTVIAAVNDLRSMDVQISRELSWERTAHDLIWELIHNPQVNELSRPARSIISFYTAGAFVLSRQSGNTSEAVTKAHLIFDPLMMEGMWAAQYPGHAMGYTICLTGGILSAMLQAPSQPAADSFVHNGIQAGLAAARRLHAEGYQKESESRLALVFPFKKVAEELSKSIRADSSRKSTPFGVVEIPESLISSNLATDDSVNSNWTILAIAHHLSARKEDGFETLESLAEDVALYSPEAKLADVPITKFGDLLTVDREEGESYRTIAALIQEYRNQEHQKRPLSFAVFGTPGSGKSFGIKQVANSILGKEVSVLEFNLSQWSGPEELYKAFHRIRDERVKGNLPLVFWDEFDTTLDEEPLGWLRYFLAPMQDGAFTHGSFVHPLGRCIFVFAGGTSKRLQEFGNDAATNKTAKENPRFVEAKGPDFLSRLKGYVNIKGPNDQSTATVIDNYFIIRRAILLRSVIQQYAPGLLQNGNKEMRIDRGVLRAFLKIPEYKHGARSMEAIVAMSMLARKSKYERSSLPPVEQLELHVDGRHFLALVHQIQLEGELLEKLAKAAHQVFYDYYRNQHGWKQGPRSEPKKTHPLLVPYEELSEIYKESNRRSVRTIPLKLAKAGYIMVSTRTAKGSADGFSSAEIEELARYEHELWVKERTAAGFTLGKFTADNPTQTECLVPWEELSKHYKELDKTHIQNIPRILAQCGYAIVKIKTEDKQTISEK